MERPRVSYDVLLLILSFSDNPTLARMMQTCKELYRPAVTCILQGLVTVHVDTSSILSLSSFLFRDPLHRIPLLRKLKIDDYYGPGWDEENLTHEGASSLKHLLDRLVAAGCLEELILYEPDDLLEEYPELFDTLGRFTSLKSIKIHGAGERSVDLLRNLESCLVTAHLAFEYWRNYDEEDFFRDHIALLSHSQHTLRELSVSRGRVEHRHENQDEPTYPNLTKLTLDNTDIIDISQYIRAFPHLQRLEMQECNTFEPDDIMMDLSDRERNEEAQKQYGSWPKLGVFDGSLCSLWELALACPISSLQLTDDDLGEVPPTMAIDVLTAARPNNLELRVCGCRVFLTDKVLRIFRHSMESLADLQSLRLDLSIAHEDREGDWHQVLDSMVSEILAPLPSLSFFKLAIKCPSISSRQSVSQNASADEDSEDSEEPLSPLLQHLADWDQTTFIERACSASRNGTLKQVEIILP
ncbi:hypothetical protein ACG7TL_004446 [Trametes sanguinea]